MNEIITIIAVTSCRIAEHIEALRRTSAALPVHHVCKLIAPVKLDWDQQWVTIPMWMRDDMWALEDYNRFIITDLYKHVDTPFVMTVHWDGYALNRDKWTDEFLKYDYVGAPWPPNMASPRRRVGNGGFSLRSRKWLGIAAEVSQTLLPTRNLPPEDVVCCQTYLNEFRLKGCTVAPVELAARFALEHPCPECPERTVKDTFGFHGAWHPDVLRYP